MQDPPVTFLLAVVGAGLWFHLPHKLILLMVILILAAPWLEKKGGKK